MLHVALRAPTGDAVIEVDGVNVVPEVHAVLDRMGDFVEPGPLAARGPVTPAGGSSVVNVGIGGSDLGPRMATTALRRLQPTGR